MATKQWQTRALVVIVAAVLGLVTVWAGLLARRWLGGVFHSLSPAAQRGIPLGLLSLTGVILPLAAWRKRTFQPPRKSQPQHDNPSNEP